jgi:hypothetical protein
MVIHLVLLFQNEVTIAGVRDAPKKINIVHDVFVSGLLRVVSMDLLTLWKAKSLIISCLWPNCWPYREVRGMETVPLLK